MDAEPKLPTSDGPRSTRRSALELAAQTASTSFRVVLTAKVLGEALRTGAMPAGFEPHIGALLDESPLSVLAKVVEQLHAEGLLPREQCWSTMRRWARQLKIARDLQPSPARDSWASET